MAQVGVLEDDPVLRNDISNALSGLGHQVTTFDDADEGMLICASERIDLLIVDLFIHRDRSFVMEGGLSFISRIRNETGNPTGADVPILAISGGAVLIGGQDPLETAVIAGATQVMRKPVNLMELLSVSQSLLGGDAEPPTGADNS